MCDYPDCYTDQFRVSRKTHRCCECNGIIFYKEKYHFFSGIYSGDASTYKTCMNCYEIREAISKECAYDESPLFGELFEWVYQSSIGYNYFEKFVDNMDRRGVKVSPSIRKELRKIQRKRK